MSLFLLKRLGAALLAMWVMSLLVFTGVFAIGNPIDVLINPAADQRIIAETIARYGFDQPLWVQYLRFLNGLLHGDFGRSFVFNEPALALIAQKLPATLELALTAMLIAVVLGLPLGLYAGLRPKDLPAQGIMAASIFGFSLPTFWVGLMLILVFSVELGWLPSGGRGETVVVFGIECSFLTVDGLYHLILPATNLALFKLSLIIRLTRAGIRETMLQDYVKFARAKGVKPARIVVVHALRNILIPIVTVIGLEFGSVVAFAVVTETIFSWPGMGRLIIESIQTLDRPVMVAYLMLVVAMFILINLSVDVLNTLLDPRLRHR
ncbi:ABC transporter permease [Pseudoroseomonas deserti]|uniref:ABC transporter permease n=1 Tax=Teichococcus deserti TaxID=1817963 RepID=A0A1V2H5F8_9PROT|nr:ABC transporter permease [Pseudoroseomonas deserti]ONG56476.1 ABC transporter permease [Pseudoroseomonas deserti]